VIFVESRVKWFNNEKGFGFIENEGEDVFVHYTSLKQSGFKCLKEGQRICFDLIKTDKGLQASNVEIIEN